MLHSAVTGTLLTPSAQWLAGRLCSATRPLLPPPCCRLASPSGWNTPLRSPPRAPLLDEPPCAPTAPLLSSRPGCRLVSRPRTLRPVLCAAATVPMPPPSALGRACCRDVEPPAKAPLPCHTRPPCSDLPTHAVRHDLHCAPHPQPHYQPEGAGLPAAQGLSSHPLLPPTPPCQLMSADLHAAEDWSPPYVLPLAPHLPCYR